MRHFENFQRLKGLKDNNYTFSILIATTLVQMPSLLILLLALLLPHEIFFFKVQGR